MSEPSDSIPQPGQENAPLTRETFTRGLSAVSAVIDTLGAQTLRVKDEGLFAGTTLLSPEQVIGKMGEARFTGAVSYDVNLHFFNEPMGVNPDEDIVAYIGVKAVEGDRDVLNSADFDGPQTQGTIMFNGDGSCLADFDFYSVKSTNKDAQMDFEDLLSRFGLGPDIFDKRTLNYDETAMRQLAANIGTLPR